MIAFIDFDRSYWNLEDAKDFLNTWKLDFDNCSQLTVVHFEEDVSVYRFTQNEKTSHYSGFRVRKLKEPGIYACTHITDESYFMYMMT